MKENLAAFLFMSPYFNMAFEGSKIIRKQLVLKSYRTEKVAVRGKTLNTTTLTKVVTK